MWTWEPSSSVEDVDIQDDLVTGWATREDAEEWMTTAFGDLLAEGVDEVTLVDGTSPQYTMHLGDD
jgi:hypothetical protein